uniref:Zinc finger protein 862like [Strongylocentrotus purpuratus] n=1 Tax=Lepeophtheirus salmonis TaxID=72036 RepID=A0A0K2U1V5_LEPSM
MSAEKKGYKVELRTFLKWKKDKILGFEIRSCGSRMYVVKIWCKVCKKHISELKSRPEYRGSVRSSIHAFADGTTSVTKHQVDRHLAGTVHAWSLELERLEPIERQVVDFSLEENNFINYKIYKKYPKKNLMIKTEDGVPLPNESFQNVNGQFKLVTKESSLSDVESAYQLALTLKVPMKLLYVTNRRISFITKKPRETAMRKLIGFLGEAVRETISSFISEANFMSIYMNEINDKVLITCRTMREGVPKCYVVDVIEPSELEGDSKDILDVGIRDIFQPKHSKLKITEEDYHYKFISFVGDGGKTDKELINSLLLKLKSGRGWLLGSNQSIHRVELACQKCLLNPKFKTVETLYSSIYDLLSQSNRFREECIVTANINNANYLDDIPKMQTDRFIGNRLSCLYQLMHNWPTYVIASERSFSSSNPYNPKVKSKISVILDRLKDYELALKCACYLDILEKTSLLSTVFESERVLPNEVKLSINKTIMDLQDLINPVMSPLEASMSYLQRYTNVEVGEDNKMISIRQRVNCEEPQIISSDLLNIPIKFDMSSLKSSIEDMKEENFQICTRVALDIMEVLQEYEKEYYNDVYDLMEWMDPSKWKDDPTYGNDELVKLSKYFAEPLKHASFDSACLLTEWSACKTLIKSRYCEFAYSKLIWEFILSNETKKFPNFSLILQIIQTLSLSGLDAENHFNKLVETLKNADSKIEPPIFSELLTISCNDSNWTSMDRKDIIRLAYHKYLNSRLAFQSEEDHKNHFSDDDDDEDMSDGESMNTKEILPD